jgi:hypothetical protein
MKRVVCVLTAGLLLAMHSAAGAAPGDNVYLRPGQIEAASDGARLNFYCMGSGSPTVVFDSGWEDWAPAWAVVQPRIAKWTRACSYERRRRLQHSRSDAAHERSHRRRVA